MTPEEYAELSGKVDELLAFKRKAEEFLTELEPMLAGLADNPMMKMLGVGKAPKLPGLGE